MDTKQFHSLWATRPIRPAAGRTVAGVCAGIAARYRVDPTLVKVAFVVAALFGGSGFLLYIAAWIAFPSASGNTIADDAHGRHGRHGHRNPGVILLVVIAILVLGSFGGPTTWSSGGLLGALLMGLGWWLLHRRTPIPPAGTSVDTRTLVNTPAPQQFQRWTPRDMTAGNLTGMTLAGGHLTGGYPSTSPTISMPTATAAPTAAPLPPTVSPLDAGPGDQPLPAAAAYHDQSVPPAWDPLGAARFAWDLPEPATSTEVVPAERRSRVGLIYLGLAVITGAAGYAAHQAGVDWLTPGRIAALSLVIVALGLIHVSLQRRRHHATAGLPTVAVLLGAAVILLTSVVTPSGTAWSGLPSGGAGERQWKPLTENDIKPEYTLTVGSMQLDLREVDLTDDRTVELRNGIGEIKVFVPEDMTIRADCSSSLGDYECPDGLSKGTAADKTSSTLTIDAHTSVGHVEIIR